MDGFDDLCSFVPFLLGVDGPIVDLSLHNMLGRQKATPEKESISNQCHPIEKMNDTAIQQKKFYPNKSDTASAGFRAC